MLMMNTGHTQVGRPSLGSWLTYGLGTDNKNLPGYVVLCPDVPTTVGPPLWNSAFLPAVHQGTFIADKVEKQTDAALDRQGLRSEEAHLLHPQRQVHADRAAARARPARDAQPDAAWSARRSTIRSSRRRSQSMEIAYRMQTEAPDVFDIRKESEATLKLYGAGQHRARLPDGGAAGRARRAHGAGLLRQGRSVGRARRHPGAPQEREGLRSAVRGGDQGSEVTRPVQGHAGRLRIGVRPHAGDGGRRRRRRRRRTAAITIRSASRCGWRAAASRAA